MKIENVFNRFIQDHWDQSSPLVLGLSGGPDSRALFYLVLDSKVPLHVAHVNHGWRGESDQEALELEALCHRKGVDFHQKKLIVPELTGNLEDACRNERLAFFKQIQMQYGCQATLLGHHADDRAETVLKRVLEGASFPNLKGLFEINCIEGVTLWRPLLSLKKQEILKWLNINNIDFFEDKTNLDPKFLRARLRQKIIPDLTESFGKGITSSLCRLADAAHELFEHCEEELLPYRKRVIENEDGVFLDFSKQTPHTQFLWKLVVRDFFAQQRISVSNHTVEAIVEHLKKRNTYKIMRIGKYCVKMHRGLLIVTVHEKRPYEDLFHQRLATDESVAKE